MTTLVPREPYSNDELDKLYPKGLKLELVQILLRHGERTPVSVRFTNAGLPAYWPYCTAAKYWTSVVMDSKDQKWSDLQWRRRLENFGKDDGPLISKGPAGETDGVCYLGELTDEGRKTTLSLGQRLRALYVDRLKFMPHIIADADMLYLRATPMPRALESMQQVFTGLYPLSARTGDFPPPTIITRALSDETLFPNESACRRFNELARAFSARAATKWNDSKEMDYINNLIGKWMSDEGEEPKRVGVDSHPRISGLMDTINSTLSHGPQTRLPEEFYDETLRRYVESIGVDEWFSGYKENKEYRTLGVGALMGDIVSRMTGSIESKGNDGVLEVGGNIGTVGLGRGGEQKIKMALSGCHDTTLAGIMASLGAFNNELWPPYTSHLAIEMFRKADVKPQPASGVLQKLEDTTAGSSETETSEKGVISTLMDKASTISNATQSAESNAGPEEEAATGIGRRKLAQLTPEERAKLDGYYVRIRYNDRPITIPGCKPAGKHLDGDETFCTLDAFKGIVEKFVPSNWINECNANRGEDAFIRAGQDGEESGF